MPPAKTLREAYNLADPTQPLPSGDPRYVNCNDVRGNEDTVTQMFRTISFSDKYTHQLFTGHRGCGKSTELLRLKERLEKADFNVVYFEVDKFLDPNDLIYTDLLLSIARRVVEEFSDEGKEILLRDELEEALRPIERWFSEVVYQENEWDAVQEQLETEASLGIGLPKFVPLIGRLFAKYTGQIKTGADIKTEIRNKLDRQISQLIEQLNDLISRINIELHKLDKKGVIVIVDNLDRVTLKELSDERTSHDALFIEHGEQLCALRCHIIYTVPISMMYARKATILRGIFPDSRVLPMIKAHEPKAKGGGDSQEGLDRLRGILDQRIDVAMLADPEAVTYLCRVSGGHPRDLMTLVRHSIEYADETQSQPITRHAAERAEARLVSAFSRMIPDEHFEKLVQVHRTNDIPNDTEHQRMLFNLSVLEYANGIEPWHDVHPAVHKLNRFKKALEDERSRQLTLDH
jgi:hypothetical protein